MMTEKQSGIYVIRCTAAGKSYIGSSANISARWRIHRVQLAKGTHHSRHLQHAWDKYGADSFIFEVVELVDPDYLLDREQFWIDETQSADRAFGYNIAPIAGNSGGRPPSPFISKNGLSGVKISAETQRKLDLLSARLGVAPHETIERLIDERLAALV